MDAGRQMQIFEAGETVVTAAEIRELVSELRARGTDTRRVEAKAARKATPKLYETLSAFANTAGGLILLGVDEAADFAISGVVDAAKVASDASSQCSEMEPVLQPTIDIVDVDGAQIVVVDLPALSGSQRPCFRRASGVQTGTYLRRHDGDVRATWPEIQLMISEQQQPEEDRRPIPTASLGDFDQKLVEGLLARVRSRRGFAGATPEQALRQLGAAIEVNGRLVPTVAGLLALGRYPQEFLGQRMCVEYVIRPSDDEARAGQRMGRSRTFSGPIPYMLEDALGALEQDISGPVYIQDGRKRTKLLYPRDALREAIANALVHRALGNVSEASAIELYPDRLVIANPGGLYGLREDELADLERRPRSISRNAVLIKLLEDVPDTSGESVVEARATGIRTMLTATREAGMAPPRFRDQIATFEVEFPKHTLLDSVTLAWLGTLPTANLGDPQRLALAMARRGEHLDNATYRQVTGIGDSRLAGRHLAQLVELGLLAMTGTRRWATYNLGSVAIQAHEPVDEPVIKPAPPTSEQARRAWILAEIDSGRPLRRPMVRTALGVSDITARRTLERMVADGLIVFEGPQRTGGYKRVIGGDDR